MTGTGTPQGHVLSELLLRWHRWTADPRFSTDHLMRELDELISRLRPCYQRALILDGRILACGAAVYSRVRLRYELRRRARLALRRLLETSHEKWLGHQVVSFNENGRRIGESNPMAKLTDQEVDLLREMREELNRDGTPRYTLRELALHFKQPRSTVSDICSGRRRAQTAAVVRER